MPMLPGLAVAPMLIVPLFSTVPPLLYMACISSPSIASVPAAVMISTPPLADDDGLRHRPGRTEDGVAGCIQDDHVIGGLGHAGRPVGGIIPIGTGAAGPGSLGQEAGSSPNPSSAAGVKDAPTGVKRGAGAWSKRITGVS